MKAQIFNRSMWIKETDPQILSYYFNEKLKESGFNICNKIEKHFEPFGYTAIWLLSESHFAIHTFPEENKSYIELSSCIENYFNLFFDKLNI